MLTKTLLNFSKMDWNQVQYPWCNNIGWLRLRIKKTYFQFQLLNRNIFKKKKVERKLKNRSGEKLIWVEVG